MLYFSFHRAYNINVEEIYNRIGRWIMTTVLQLPNYVKAARESLKPRSQALFHDCLNAELADLQGDTVYFRNYEDTDVEYIEFAFTRLGVGRVRLETVSYKGFES